MLHLPLYSQPNCLDVKPNDTGQAWKSLLLLGDNGCTFSIDQPLSQPGSVSSGEGKAAELNEGNVTGHPPEQSKTSPAKGTYEGVSALNLFTYVGCILLASYTHALLITLMGRVNQIPFLYFWW